MVINAGNIAALSDKAEVNQHNAFLSEAINAQPGVTVVVDTDRLQRPFDDGLIGEHELTQLAQSFKDHALVCVKADICFGPRADQAGSILICTQKTDGGRKGRHIVARSGLVLSDYSDRNFQRASNACVVVQPDDLGSLLRSIENPAHSEWLPGDADPHKCAFPGELIQFIRYAHNALDRVLANLDTADDLNIFSDLVPAGPRSQSNGVKRPPFEIRMASDRETFELKPAEAYDAEPGAIWRVSLIYDSVYGSGRARKGYRPGTFDLRTVPLQIKGGTVLERGDCHFDVAVKKPQEFQMTFGPCGFAGWADVRMHAELRNAGDEGEA